MNTRTYASVWDALVDDPAEAADLTERSILLVRVRDRVRSWALADNAAADRLGVAPGVLRDLVSANLTRFPRAELVDLARRAERDPA